jgi:hypothetical protein
LYELALIDWHLTPEYINEHWTEELLCLMFVKRRERIERITPSQMTEVSGVKKIGNKEFFERHRIKVKKCSPRGAEVTT